MELSDDGHGFVIAQKQTLGNGLQNMKKRTEIIGGQFNLKSDSSGTSLTIKLPLAL